MHPKAYFLRTAFSEFAQNGCCRNLACPVVLGNASGSFGAYGSLQQYMVEILEHITEKPFILQKFIKASIGCDKRLEVVGGKLLLQWKEQTKMICPFYVQTAEREALRVPTENEIRLAVKACEELGLYFGG